jgi:type IV secretion system protein VirB9
MKKIFFASITILILSVVTCQAADYLSPVNASLTTKEKKALDLQDHWEKGTLEPVTVQNGKTCFVYGHCVPTIVVAPYKVSDLELQPGEVINSMVLGDNARWFAEIIFSGIGGVSTSHVVFKALNSGLKTTVVITTDRRVYHINLKSDRQKHMLYSGFMYPREQLKIADDAQARITAEQTKKITAEGFDISKLNFDYEISGDAGWKPLQIFDNGIKTYIKLPKMEEMPMFLVKTTAGKGLVNYRVKNNCFIVDRIFDEAYLIIGVDKEQEKITLKRLGV